MADTTLLVVVVGTALAFDFTNGFHDTANAMATSIATGAPAGRPPPVGRATGSSQRVAGYALAALCLAVCMGAVGFGIWVMLDE